ncbi:MAG: S8 family serine peptidase [Bacteroidota bacterium]
MKTPIDTSEHFSPAHALWFAIFLAAAFVLTGCDVADVNEPTDGLGASPLTASAPMDGKLRHGHLMDRATRTVTASARGGEAPENSIGLIVGLDTYKILDRYGELDLQKILDRYQEVDEYRILDRYEYDHVFDGFAIWADEGYIDELLRDMADDDEISWVEPDITVKVHPLGITMSDGTSSETTPWGVARIGAGTGDASSVDLFVIDTGLSLAKNDLHASDGVDFTGDPGGTADFRGHGTHLAGTAAALANGYGVRGVAPGANVHPLRVLSGYEDDDDYGPVELSRAIAAVEYVTGEKLRRPNTPMVVNFSLGADVGTARYNALDEAIVASIETGVTYIISAGNDRIDAAMVTPAHVREAITVGAYDQHNRFASFSNYGAVVDLHAPGVNVLSLASSRAGDGSDGQTAVMSGTSMAAAHVSGAAALVLQAHPHASPRQVARALLATAQATVTGTPRQTTDRSVWVGEGGAASQDLPPFFQYALTAGDDIKTYWGTLSVLNEGSGVSNANVFANDRLYLHESGSRFEGFGYYGTSVNRPAAFHPAYNPTRLPSTMRQKAIEVPSFRAEDFSRLATERSSSRSLSGHVRLGTQDRPAIVYVDGNLSIDGPTQISGYGIFLVTGTVTVNASVKVDGNDALGIYANGAIYMQARGSTVAAQLFSRGDIIFRAPTSLYGTATAGDDVQVQSEGVEVHYRPASPALTEPLWPVSD